ncbi:hypothetical protein [Actinoplanes regularis]|uniref:hypothetical protein n=1 Tax=Actinoplanes regularis TaxID=52697 RepID=UPI0024A2BCAF|nr:hypothetical protein [Actinoplanes regularis]GLW28183.1 hypothetical protein Areg01_11230 [Actinoplanes regularis]
MSDMLERLLASAESATILRFLADFDALDVDSAAGSTARLSSGADLELIARCGAGGRFFRTKPGGQIWYADSEGSAGVIGSGLETALALLVAAPNWHDLLGFSGGGDLDEMRRAHDRFAAGVREEYPDLAGEQATVVAELGLVLPEDPVRALWAAVHARDPEVVFTDVELEEYAEEPWDSLFGAHTIDRLRARRS